MNDGSLMRGAAEAIPSTNKEETRKWHESHW